MADIRTEDWNWENEWAIRERAKTGVVRTAWLWPESRKATEAARGTRLNGLLLQAGNGLATVRIQAIQGTKGPGRNGFTMIDRLSPTFRTARTSAGIYGPLVFYDLRRTPRTVLAEHDVRAETCAICMGHTEQSMGERYTYLKTHGKEIKNACQIVRRGGWVTTDGHAAWRVSTSPTLCGWCIRRS